MKWRELYNFLGRFDDAYRMQGHFDDMLDKIETHALGWRVVYPSVRCQRLSGRIEGHVKRAKYISKAKHGASSVAQGQNNGREAKDGYGKSVHEPSLHAERYRFPAAALQPYYLELAKFPAIRPDTRKMQASSATTTGSISTGAYWLTEIRRSNTISSICPSAKESQIDTYRCEPYVYAQMIAGRDAATPGEAKNSWLTGTAAWTLAERHAGLLGVQPESTASRSTPVFQNRGQV